MATNFPQQLNSAAVALGLMFGHALLKLVAGKRQEGLERQIAGFLYNEASYLD